jgi:hypothetical protein
MFRAFLEIDDKRDRDPRAAGRAACRERSPVLADADSTAGRLRGVREPRVIYALVL